GRHIADTDVHPEALTQERFRPVEDGLLGGGRGGCPRTHVVRALYFHVGAHYHELWANGPTVIGGSSKWFRGQRCDGSSSGWCWARCSVVPHPRVPPSRRSRRSTWTQPIPSSTAEDSRSSTTRSLTSRSGSSPMVRARPTASRFMYTAPTPCS